MNEDNQAQQNPGANNNTDPQQGQQQEPQSQVQNPVQEQNPGANNQDGNTRLAGEPPQGAPEAYDFTGSLPEGEELDETIAQSFGEICKGMNLTNEQANQMAAYGYEYAKGLMEQVNDQRERQIDSWAEETKKTLGADFDKTMNEYGAGLQYLEKTSPEIRKVLNETGAGNRIEIVRAISELGRLVSEDRGIGGGSTQGGGKTSLYPNTDFNNY